MPKQTGRRVVQPVPSPVIRPVSPRAVQPTITVVQEQTTMETLHTGPIPSPDVFKAYGEVLQDAPDRILRMAEDEAKGRRDREMWKVKGDVILAPLGVVCGFAIGVTTVIAGASVVMAGHDLAGFGLGGTGLASLVGVFIYGTRAIAASKDAAPTKDQTVAKTDK